MKILIDIAVGRVTTDKPITKESIDLAIILLDFAYSQIKSAELQKEWKEKSGQYNLDMEKWDKFLDDYNKT